MFFVLSKLLFYILMPITFILVALLVAIFAKNQKRKRRALVAGLVLLLFFTNPFFINEAYLWWEAPPTPIATLKPYDAAIILTGISTQDKSPHDRMYTGSAADRVLHPLRLYKLGLVRSFVVTGGSGSLMQKRSTESAQIRELLMIAGVPQNRIIIEEQSRNTRENAQFTAPILRAHPELKRLLLVTSAFHIRRAKGCFEKAGIQADTFATDFNSFDRAYTPDRLLVPQEVNLYKWQRLIHEMIGYVVYKLMGYL